MKQDILRLAYALLALIPLCYFIRYLPSSKMRYAYSLVFALVLQAFVYQESMYPVYVQNIIAFLLIKLNPKNLGAWVTFESMLFLSGYHVYNYFYNYGGWTLDASTLLMILVCKYSLLAYNIEDGKKVAQTLSKQQLKFRIVQNIKFLEYLGYLNFLPTSLMGPPVEYQYYKQYMQQKQHYANIPSTITPTLKVFAQTCLFLSLYLIGQQFIPLAQLKNDSVYQQGSWHLYFYITLSVYLLRCKYHFGWKLSMCSVHASGVSYSGKDFKLINTINPWVFQTDLHIKNKVNNWNIGVQEWLRKSIYQRSPFKSQSSNQLYVFMISAFWHGFYQAYYISFFLWFVQLFLNGLMYKYFKNDDQPLVRIYKKTGKVGYYVLAMLNSQMWNHIGVYMIILEGQICWKIMQHLYFAPQIVLILGLLIFMALPQSKSKQKPEDNEVKKLQ